MTDTTFDIRRRADAPPGTVWALLADPDSWTEWAGYDAVEIIEQNEHGLVRSLRSGEATVRELVTAAEPVHHYTYEHLSGLPVYRYVGEITLDGDRGGTRITWHAEVDPLTADSRAIAGVLRSVIEDAADRLVGSAERARRG